MIMMSKKADIGFLQELQPNGMVANSTTRLISFIFGLFTIMLVGFLAFCYTQAISELFVLVDKRAIDQGSLVVMIKSLNIIDPMLLVILGTMIFVPKYLQKLAELKLGKLSDLTASEQQAGDLLNTPQDASAGK